MKWKILNKTRNYDGHFKVDKLILQHELFVGGMSKELVRERVTRKNAVAVLPYDPIRDEVVLVEQFRVGALKNDNNPWLIEIIAGLVEDGEEYEEVARREAIEEADCKLENLFYVTSFYPTPGGFAEVSHVYIGKTDTTGLGGICGLPDEGEDIRVHIVSASKAFDMLNNGEICSAISMIAMYNFMQLHNKLKKQWAN